jgi:hypothetical protein
MATFVGSERLNNDIGRGRRRALIAAAALTVSALAWDRWGWGTEAVLSEAIYYYSTAEAPRDFRGPGPQLILLAKADSSTSESTTARALDVDVIRAKAPKSEPEPAPVTPSSKGTDEAPRRVASTVGGNLSPTPAKPPAETPTPDPAKTKNDPIAEALQAIAACQAQFAKVRDYTCTFYKRERIDGRMKAPAVMAMKARCQPHSIYFKFVSPNRGREAIYVAGRNRGRVVAHDVGIGKLFAGTMNLDPNGSTAMEDNRHPITEAGIGALIETVAKRWAAELTPEESQITINPGVRVGNRPATMIESGHARKRPEYLFHMVKLYIDHEHGLPIRFEAYDWPKRPGAPPELVEEYTYMNLKVNVGLAEQDFDPSNPQYAFGRF